MGNDTQVTRGEKVLRQFYYMTLEYEKREPILKI